MKTVFIDKSGKIISRAQWVALSGDRSYKVIREYDNGKLHIALTWEGFENNVKTIPREYWKLYKVTASNYIVSGERAGSFVKKRVPDPSLTKSFPTELGALNYYETTLIKLGCAEFNLDEDEKFVEIGNLIKRAEPVVIVPGTIKTKSTIAGSW